MTVAEIAASLPAVLWVGIAVLAVVFTAQAVRYVRADPMTRVSIRQAARIRRGWVRLARAQGLSVTDRVPTAWSQISAGVNGGQGRTPEPRVLVPKIRVRPDRFGVEVRAKTLPRVGLADFQKAAPYLADAWRCTRVSVLPDGPGAVRIRGVRHDPLATRTEHVPSGESPAVVSRWALGLDEYASEVVVSLAEVPGVTVAGLPGFGKTSLINKLICDLAPSPAVQFAVADGKASTAEEGDYADVADRLFAFVGDDLAAGNELFKRLVALRRSRSAAIRSALGVRNMWHCGPCPAWPLTVLIIDEAHTFFREHKGNDPATKKLAALASENARLVEDLVKKGRSVGILVILATQKATGDAIPTFIRDVCPVGLSFAQKTIEAAVAALGEDIRNWPEANPVTLQDPTYVGVAVMTVQGREGFTRVRTPYVDDTHAARIAADTAHLTRDPAELLAGAEPLSPTEPEDWGGRGTEAA
ncbi:FtsK/SpoIIIE domain-containing protein [Streptomyces sp. NBC_01803]|uniref:FtsK/SpoIIIE domain-containing protein n=1 Tax=Streptomyces sp. NBC_01803 TaxID=2975946 RepID=UPI002DD92C2A|nr:FtsK/SpoIIIE domain-containing protein [Streptomyces sp. NBC_01803]WSA45103.1 FtsK/SpoIIIE domain-containing protein [Streptomyces sp. NBC_01803]